MSSAPQPPPLPPISEPLPPVDEQLPEPLLGEDAAEKAAAWLTSTLVHCVVIAILALLGHTVRLPVKPKLLLALAADSDATAAIETDSPPLVIKPDTVQGFSPAEERAQSLESVSSPPQASPPGSQHADKPSSNSGKEPSAGEGAEESADVESYLGRALTGRNPSSRAALAGRHGGNQQSELTVERGLRWLAAHQREDGSWCFDLNKPPCNGMCSHGGTESSLTAATALALLPFLGAGYTHAGGEHRKTVREGLYFLTRRAVVLPQGIDLRDGSMYGHALATITLCEAYAMTRDPTLKDIAQGALRFVVYAQDLRGGGWRYEPGAPGDITVTGWQLMALRSGQMARLEVPSPTLGLVRKFLDEVQTDGGARYRYQTIRPPEQTTTAIGLLCRMYTGWSHNHPALYQGVAFLDRWGPAENNMYYNYYATQVMHFWGGQQWETWNRRMRDRLIASQAATGHEAGSWYFPDRYGDKGGRLYNTALAILTLEVYYRYLPLYSEEAVHQPR